MEMTMLMWLIIYNNVKKYDNDNYAGRGRGNENAGDNANNGVTIWKAKYCGYPNTTAKIQEVMQVNLLICGYTNSTLYTKFAIHSTTTGMGSLL